MKEPIELTPEDKMRFEDKIYYSPDGCWYWLGSRTPDGYGNFHMNGTMAKAHRISFIIHTKQSPKGFSVLHSCDNPGCVNPWHLRLGTPHDNNMDMAARGRSTHGERHPKAKFTYVQIQAIRDAFDAGHRQCDICRYFKRGDSIINLIVKRKIWTRMMN